MCVPNIKQRNVSIPAITTIVHAMTRLHPCLASADRHIVDILKIDIVVHVGNMGQKIARLSTMHMCVHVLFMDQKIASMSAMHMCVHVGNMDQKIVSMCVHMWDMDQKIASISSTHLRTFSFVGSKDSALFDIIQ